MKDASIEIINSLKSDNSTERYTAVKELEKVGDSSAIKHLIDTLKDSDERVRREAADALERLNWLPSNDESGAYFWIAKDSFSKCVKFGKIAVEPLIAALGYINWTVLDGVADAIGSDRRSSCGRTIN